MRIWSKWILNIIICSIFHSYFRSHRFIFFFYVLQFNFRSKEGTKYLNPAFYHHKNNFMWLLLVFYVFLLFILNEMKMENEEEEKME